MILEKTLKKINHQIDDIEKEMTDSIKEILEKHTINLDLIPCSLDNKRFFICNCILINKNIVIVTTLNGYEYNQIKFNELSFSNKYHIFYIINKYGNVLH